MQHSPWISQSLTGGELKETRKQKQELKARQEENQSQLEERAEEVQNCMVHIYDN